MNEPRNRIDTRSNVVCLILTMILPVYLLIVFLTGIEFSPIIAAAALIIGVAALIRRILVGDPDKNESEAPMAVLQRARAEGESEEDAVHDWKKRKQAASVGSKHKKTTSKGKQKTKKTAIPYTNIDTEKDRVPRSAEASAPQKTKTEPTYQLVGEFDKGLLIIKQGRIMLNDTQITIEEARKIEDESRSAERRNSRITDTPQTEPLTDADISGRYELEKTMRYKIDRYWRFIGDYKMYVFTGGRYDSNNIIFDRADGTVRAVFMKRSCSECGESEFKSEMFYVPREWLQLDWESFIDRFYITNLALMPPDRNKYMLISDEKLKALIFPNEAEEVSDPFTEEDLVSIERRMHCKRGFNERISFYKLKNDSITAANGWDDCVEVTRSADGKYIGRFRKDRSEWRNEYNTKQEAIDDFLKWC